MLERHLILSAISLLFRSKLLLDQEAETEGSKRTVLSTG